mgnify:CR=1 FL=1
MTPLNSGDTLHGQAHVVFRDGGQPGARAQIVAAVGGLHFSVERVLIRKIMQQAVALDAQESAALLVHYGDILKALGENFMAEIYWRKALEKGYDAGRIERRITESKAKKE